MSNTAENRCEITPPHRGSLPLNCHHSPCWELSFLSCLFIPQQFSAKDVSQEAHSWLPLLAFPPTQLLVTLL